MGFSVLVEEWEGGEKSRVGKVEDNIVDIKWKKTNKYNKLSMTILVTDENIGHIHDLNNVGQYKETLTIRYLDENGNCIGNTTLSVLRFKSLKLFSRKGLTYATVVMYAHHLSFAKVKFVL